MNYFILLIIIYEWRAKQTLREFETNLPINFRSYTLYEPEIQEMFHQFLSNNFKPNIGLLVTFGGWSCNVSVQDYELSFQQNARKMRNKLMNRHWKTHTICCRNGERFLQQSRNSPIAPCKVARIHSNKFYWNDKFCSFNFLLHFSSLHISCFTSRSNAWVRVLWASLFIIRHVNSIPYSME